MEHIKGQPQDYLKAVEREATLRGTFPLANPMNMNQPNVQPVRPSQPQPHPNPQRTYPLVPPKAQPSNPKK